MYSGSSPVNPLAAPPREDLVLAQRPVADDRLWSPPALRQHDIQVPGQHLPHGASAPSLAGHTCVALPLQLTHPRADRLERLALDVPAVGLAVSPGAHPDTRLVVAAVVRGCPDPRLAVAAPGAGHSLASHSASFSRCASR